MWSAIKTLGAKTRPTGRSSKDKHATILRFSKYKLSILDSTTSRVLLIDTSSYWSAERIRQNNQKWQK